MIPRKNKRKSFPHSFAALTTAAVLLLTLYPNGVSHGTLTLPDSNVLFASGGDCPPKQWRIVVTGNLAYEEDFLNWWGGCLRAGLCGSGCETADVVLYAEDTAMYKLYKDSTKIDVKAAWEISSKYKNTDLSNRFDYEDKQGGFRHMMSRRPSILLQELEAMPITSILLFMDLDILIRKDPRPFITGNYDFWGADSMTEGSGPYNAGFLAIRPTDAMKDVVQRWRGYLEKQEKPKANQRTFNNIVRKSSVKPKLLDRRLFPVGKILLNVKTLDAKSVGEEVVVFHNNFCGMTCNKTGRAEVLGLWSPVRREDLAS